MCAEIGAILFDKAEVGLCWAGLIFGACGALINSLKKEKRKGGGFCVFSPPLSFFAVFANSTRDLRRGCAGRTAASLLH